MTSDPQLKIAAWLQSAIPDSEHHTIHVASRTVRDILVKQCLFHFRVYHDVYAVTQESVVGLKVGIIGLGQVGMSLLREALKFRYLEPENFMVSTRSPDKHHSFQSQGVRIMFDNESIARECDIIYLCCLPFQAERVCTSIKHILNEKMQDLFPTQQPRPKTIVLSLLAATPISKLRQYTDNYPYILRCYVDADYISQSIRSDPSHMSTVTAELVHNMNSHIVGSTTDLQTLCEMYNMVFYGHMNVKPDVLNCFGDESLNEGGVWATDEVCCQKFQERFWKTMKEMGLFT